MPGLLGESKRRVLFRYYVPDVWEVDDVQYVFFTSTPIETNGFLTAVEFSVDITGAFDLLVVDMSGAFEILVGAFKFYYEMVCEGSSQAFASIRKHSQAFASIRKHSQAFASIRKHSQAFASIRKHSQAFASIRKHSQAFASIRKHSQAFASIRKHSQAFASIRNGFEGIAHDAGRQPRLRSTNSIVKSDIDWNKAPLNKKHFMRAAVLAKGYDLTFTLSYPPGKSIVHDLQVVVRAELSTREPRLITDRSLDMCIYDITLTFTNVDDSVSNTQRVIILVTTTEETSSNNHRGNNSNNHRGNNSNNHRGNNSNNHRGNIRHHMEQKPLYPVNKTHLYSEGTYTVNVFAENLSNNDSDDLYICIEIPDTGNWVFPTDLPQLHAPGLVEITANLGAGIKIPTNETFSIDYGDGSIIEVRNVGRASGFGPETMTFSHTFISAGNYTISINASNQVSSNVYTVEVNGTINYLKDGLQVIGEGPNNDIFPAGSPIYIFAERVPPAGNFSILNLNLIDGYGETLFEYYGADETCGVMGPLPDISELTESEVPLNSLTIADMACTHIDVVMELNSTVDAPTHNIRSKKFFTSSKVTIDCEILPGYTTTKIWTVIPIDGITFEELREEAFIVKEGSKYPVRVVKHCYVYTVPSPVGPAMWEPLETRVTRGFGQLLELTPRTSSVNPNLRNDSSEVRHVVYMCKQRGESFPQIPDTLKAPPRVLAADRSPITSNAGLGGCFGNGPGFVDIGNMDDATLNPDTFISLGPYDISAIIFSNFDGIQMTSVTNIEVDVVAGNSTAAAYEVRFVKIPSLDQPILLCLLGTTLLFSRSKKRYRSTPLLECTNTEKCKRLQGDYVGIITNIKTGIELTWDVHWTSPTFSKIELYTEVNEIETLIPNGYEDHLEAQTELTSQISVICEGFEDPNGEGIAQYSFKGIEQDTLRSVIFQLSDRKYVKILLPPTDSLFDCYVTVTNFAGAFTTILIAENVKSPNSSKIQGSEEDLLKQLNHYTLEGKSDLVGEILTVLSEGLKEKSEETYPGLSKVSPSQVQMATNSIGSHDDHKILIRDIAINRTSYELHPKSDVLRLPPHLSRSILRGKNVKCIAIHSCSDQFRRFDAILEGKLTKESGSGSKMTAAMLFVMPRYYLDKYPSDDIDSAVGLSQMTRIFQTVTNMTNAGVTSENKVRFYQIKHIILILPTILPYIIEIAGKNLSQRLYPLYSPPKN
ncbi:hypothetical protein GQR58_024452 [Nymphon striatum]|nr:hypothetical protein GQR58_024452 [Nymphon striatum]